MAKAYSTANLESGWVPAPVRRSSGEAMSAYREWLRRQGGFAGGSFHAAEIDDYYLTPYELGYGRAIEFDHDFVGRDALERRWPGGPPARR